MMIPACPATRIPALLAPTTQARRCFLSPGPRLAGAGATAVRAGRFLLIRPGRREAAMSRRPRDEGEGVGPARLGCWGQAAIVALFLVIFLLAAPWPR